MSSAKIQAEQHNRWRQLLDQIYNNMSKNTSSRNEVSKLAHLYYTEGSIENAIVPLKECIQEAVKKANAHNVSIGKRCKIAFIVHDSFVVAAREQNKYRKQYPSAAIINHDELVAEIIKYSKSAFECNAAEQTFVSFIVDKYVNKSFETKQLRNLQKWEPETNTNINCSEMLHCRILTIYFYRNTKTMFGSLFDSNGHKLGGEQGTVYNNANLRVI